MKVLFLRPEGSFVPQSPNFIELNILKPICINYEIDIEGFDGIGFTSVNAVKCFKHFNEIKGKQIFAVGEATKDALAKIGFQNVLVPEEYTVKDLVDLMLRKTSKPLLVRSKIALDEKIPITQIADYSLEVNEEELNKARELLSDCKVDIVVLTSSTIASLVKDFIKDCEIIVSIGPSTSKVVQDKKNIYEAKEHDMKGILKLLKELGAYNE